MAEFNIHKTTVKPETSLNVLRENDKALGK